MRTYKEIREQVSDYSIAWQKFARQIIFPKSTYYQDEDSNHINAGGFTGLYVPLTGKIISMLETSDFTKEYAIHTTNLSGALNIYKLQKNKNIDISVYYGTQNIDYTGGVHRYGCVLFLKGLTKHGLPRDIFSVPDRSGLRWVRMEFLVDPLYYKDDGLRKYFTEFYMNFTEELIRESEILDWVGEEDWKISIEHFLNESDTWNLKKIFTFCLELVDFIIAYGDVQANKNVTDLQNKYVKVYIIGITNFIEKNKHWLRKPSTDSRDYYPSYGEKVMTDFTIEAAFFLQNAKYDNISPRRILENNKIMKTLENSGIHTEIIDTQGIAYTTDLNDIFEKKFRKLTSTGKVT